MNTSATIRRSFFLPLLLLLVVVLARQAVAQQQPVLINGQDKKVQSLLFSPDGKSLFVGYDYSTEASLAKFDVASPDQPPVVMAKKIIAVDHLFLDSAGNRLLAGDIGGDMLEWDLTQDGAEPDKQWKFSQEKGLVKAMAVSPDGKQLVGGHDQAVKLVDRNTREVIRTFTGHAKKVEDVAFSADGKYIASAGDHEKLRVWDTAGQQLGEYPLTHAILAYSPTENLVAYQGVVSEADFNIHLVEIPAMKERGVLKVGYFQLSSLTFSPDGSMVAAGSEKGMVIVWNAATGVQVAQLADTAADTKQKISWVRALAFSPDSKTLAIGGDHGNVKLVSLGSVKPAVKPGAMVATPAVDTPGETPAAGGPLDLSGQNVRIWRSSNGKFSIKAKLVAYENEVASLETPDGRTIKVPANKLGIRERKYLRELK